MKNRSLVISILVGFISLSFNSLHSYIYPYETPLTKYLEPIEITHFESGLPLIDCIYVLNLDERPKKWEKVKKLFDERGMNVNRVSGINGWEFSQEICEELAGPYPLKICGGQLGCLLSHVSIIKDAYDRGFNIIWVFEDDIEFVEDVNQIPQLLTEFSRIDPDWDIFYTDIDQRALPEGYYYRPNFMAQPRPDQPLYPLQYYFTRIQLSKNIMQTRYRWGTHSMVISRNGMKKILDYFTHVYLWAPVDVDLHLISGIREYSPIRDIVSNERFGVNDTSSDTRGESTLNKHK